MEARNNIPNNIDYNVLPEEPGRNDVELKEVRPNPKPEGQLDDEEIQPGVVNPAPRANRNLFAKLRANKKKLIALLFFALTGYLLYLLINQLTSKNSNNTDPDEPLVPDYPFPVDPILCPPVGEEKLQKIIDNPSLNRMRIDYPALGNRCRDNDPKANFLPYETYGNFPDSDTKCFGRINFVRGIFATNSDEAWRLTKKAYKMMDPNLAGTPEIFYEGIVDRIECTYPWGKLFKPSDPDYTCVPPYLFTRTFTLHKAQTSIHCPNNCKNDIEIKNTKQEDFKTSQKKIDSTQKITAVLQKIKSEQVLQKNLTENNTQAKQLLQTINKNKTRKLLSQLYSNSTAHQDKCRKLLWFQQLAHKLKLQDDVSVKVCVDSKRRIHK